jgi:methionyl-tRNA formyltransferase
MSQPSLPSLRLILFTMYPPTAVHTLIKAFEALGQQVLLVVTSPGRKSRPNPMYQGIVARSSGSTDILVTSHMDRLPAIISGLAPDLIFTASFPFRFSPELLELPRLGCVNAHFSLLPKYRGPNPLFWQFINGETQTGITLHRMDANFNTGPILVQRELALPPKEDARSLWNELVELEVSMLPEMLEAVISGYEGRPQPLASVSYAPHCGEADYHLDWTRPATYLHNQIRALAWVGAQALIDGQNMRVRSARVVKYGKSPRVRASRAPRRLKAPVPAEPGRLLACSSEGILIQTGQDALLVTEYVSIDQIRTYVVPETR